MAIKNTRAIEPVRYVESYRRFYSRWTADVSETLHLIEVLTLRAIDCRKLIGPSQTSNNLISLCEWHRRRLGRPYRGP